MLRSSEACGKAGVYGLRYLSRGKLEKKLFHNFIRNEMLRKEYLNQTFQVLPEIQDDYRTIVHDEDFEAAQHKMFTLQGIEWTAEDGENYEATNRDGRRGYYIKF